MALGAGQSGAAGAARSAEQVQHARPRPVGVSTRTAAGETECHFSSISTFGLGFDSGWNRRNDMPSEPAVTKGNYHLASFIWPSVKDEVLHELHNSKKFVFCHNGWKLASNGMPSEAKKRKMEHVEHNHPNRFEKAHHTTVKSSKLIKLGVFQQFRETRLILSLTDRQSNGNNLNNKQPPFVRTWTSC